jgi:peptide deformylase
MVQGESSDAGRTASHHPGPPGGWIRRCSSKVEAVDAGPASTSELLPITLFGNPILRRRCREVTEFGDDLAVLIDEMFRTLHATDNGVGLSANQVGRTERVFVFDFHDGMAGHVVNPVLIAVDGQLQQGDEACLSLPGLGLPTARMARGRVRGVDRHGTAVDIEGEGLVARCFQHELDHLNGKLYPDLHPVGVRKRLEGQAAELAWYGHQALDPRSELYLGLPEPPEGSD